MQESIHGRNVLNLVKEYSEAVKREALNKHLEETFGRDARFHTCSAQDMTASQLLDMFLEKGKLEETSEGIRHLGCQCKHH